MFPRLPTGSPRRRRRPQRRTAETDPAYQVNFGAFRGSFLESTPCSCRTQPPDVVWGVPWTATRGGAGWRGRIRTFDLLIQSQIPESGLADAVLNVIQRSTALGFRVSQVPIRKRIRCPSENRMSKVPFGTCPESNASRRHAQIARFG